MLDYNNDRHWEVNGPRYKKTNKETVESDFKDLNRFLVGRKRHEAAGTNNKEAGKMNRFLDKIAAELTPQEEAMASLAYLGGAGVGAGSVVAGSAAKQLSDAYGGPMQKGLHPDVAGVVRGIKRQQVKDVAKNILRNPATTAGAVAFKRPEALLLGGLGGGALGSVAYGTHALLNRDESEQEKSAFAEMRGYLEKSASRF